MFPKDYSYLSRPRDKEKNPYISSQLLFLKRGFPRSTSAKKEPVAPVWTAGADNMPMGALMEPLMELHPPMARLQPPIGFSVSCMETPTDMEERNGPPYSPTRYTRGMVGESSPLALGALDTASGGGGIEIKASVLAFTPSLEGYVLDGEANREP